MHDYQFIKGDVRAEIVLLYSEKCFISLHKEIYNVTEYISYACSARTSPFTNLRLYCLYAFYTISTQISDFNYPISNMCCPIMSVIFGKGLYLIPQKMPLKRYGRFRAYHAYIMVTDYQTAGSPYPPATFP